MLDDEEVPRQQGKSVIPLTEIRISTGVGVAETQLSAFDAALYGAGIGDVNLLPLSSVIPPGADVVQKQPDLTGTEWGDRLYVVLAEQGAGSMREYRPEVFGPVQSVLRGARCAGRPVSALVAATYQSQPW